MKIFLDFDGTLLQTVELFAPAVKSVVAIDGAMPKRVRPVDFSSVGGDGRPLFTPVRYLDQFDLTPERSRACLATIDQIMTRTQSMLFPDVEGFLTQFPPTDLAILTYGDAAFQETKIRSSGLVTRVAEVHTTSGQSKCAYIANFALSKGFSGGSLLVLIDDKKEYFVDRNAYDQPIVGVWLDRLGEGGSHQASVRVTSLREAAEFLKGLDSGLAKV